MAYFWNKIISYEKCRYEEYYARNIKNLPQDIDNVTEKGLELAKFIIKIFPTPTIEPTEESLPHPDKKRADSTVAKLLSGEETSLNSDLVAVGCINDPRLIQVAASRMSEIKYVYIGMQKLLKIYKKKTPEGIISKQVYLRPEEIMTMALERLYNLPEEIFSDVYSVLSIMKKPPKQGKDKNPFISYRQYLAVWALKAFFNINPDRNQAADIKFSGCDIVAEADGSTYEGIRKAWYGNHPFGLYHLYELDEFEYLCRKLKIRDYG